MREVVCSTDAENRRFTVKYREVVVDTDLEPLPCQCAKEGSKKRCLENHNFSECNGEVPSLGFLCEQRGV